MVLGDLEELHGDAVRWGKATQHLDFVLHELGLLGEVCVVAAVLGLAQIVGHLVVFVEDHGHQIGQSCGLTENMGLR